MNEEVESPDDDHEMLMDSCASECMEALESKDKAKFRESFQTLLADLLNKMESREDNGS